MNPTDFEVIIVDDGSTDDTAEIADKLAESGKYSNLRVIHQKNEGLSGARNTGIRNAVGDYIWCIDSDDYIKYDSVKNIMGLICQYVPDILFIELVKLMHDGNTSIICHQRIEKNKVMTGRDAILKNYSPCSVCSTILRRNFISDNKLRFYPRLYHQDTEFVYRAVALAKKVIFSDFQPYIYEKHPNTISTSLDKDEIIKRLVDNGIIADSFMKFAQDLTDPLLRNRVEQQSDSIIQGTIYSLVQNPIHREKSIQNVVIKEFRKFGFFPMKMKNKGLKKLVLTLCLNIKFRHYGI